MHPYIPATVDRIHMRHFTITTPELSPSGLHPQPSSRPVNRFHGCRALPPVSRWPGSTPPKPFASPEFHANPGHWRLAYGPITSLHHNLTSQQYHDFYSSGLALACLGKLRSDSGVAPMRFYNGGINHTGPGQKLVRASQ